MTEFEQKLIATEFIGIVEDNNDPDKKQRVRIRIPYLHGDSSQIPTDALAWAQPNRDNNGLSFSIPDINKIVNVTFPTGNLYFPVYKNAQHLNINLQKKIESYSDNDYTSFFALCYNHNTQVFIDKDALNMFHKFNGVSISEDDLTLITKDRSSKILIGNRDADQPIILGDKFFNWFDTLMDALTSAYLCTAPGAPVVAAPNLILALSQYKAQRSTMLSKNAFVIDNLNQTKNKLDVVDQIGDKVEITTPKSSVNVSISSNVNINDTTQQTTDTQTQNKESEINNGDGAEVAKAEPKQIINTDLDVIIEEENTSEFEVTNDITDDTYEDNDNFYIDSTIDDSAYENQEYNSDDEYEDELITDDNEITITSSNMLSFDLSSKQFLKSNLDSTFDTTYRLYLDSTKLPKPILTKSKLIKWKLEVEGGLSRSKYDSAASDPDNICPTPYKGLKGWHTNKGVTYSVWVKTFKNNNDKRFLEMSQEDWEEIFNKKYWNKNAKSKYESVNCLLTSFAWGGVPQTTIKAAKKLLNVSNLDNVEEKKAIAALLSARMQTFINISQPPRRNFKNRKGWMNAVNKLIKLIYS